MTNADKFKRIFGTYATEIWTKPEKEFVDWLNEDVPEADVVKRKVGKWIKQYDENCWWYECSECGDYPLKTAYGHDMLSSWCPWCGAKMEGEEDAEVH
jgi:hypothetical protein